MSKHLLRERPWLVVPWLGIAVLAVTLPFAAACGGGDNEAEAAEVEATVVTAFDAWNAGDLDGFLSALTDAAIESEFEATREEAAEFLAEDVGEPGLTVSNLSNTEVSGDTATTEGTFAVNTSVTPERFSLVRRDGRWLIDNLEPMPGEAPAGSAALDLALTEYAFNFDAAAVDGGNVAFNVRNIGGDQHFVDLVRVPEDLDIEAAIGSDEEPSGIEQIGGTDILEPGTETVLFFTEDLEPGRYVMVCWIEAADGTPHAVKGMWAEFTVAGGSAAAPR